MERLIFLLILSKISLVHTKLGTSKYFFGKSVVLHLLGDLIKGALLLGRDRERKRRGKHSAPRGI